MERRTPWLGYLCVILSAVIFGCMPLGANFLYAQGVTPMSLVFLRNLLSLPVLALLCQKQGGLRISRGALLETFAAAFFALRSARQARNFAFSLPVKPLGSSGWAGGSGFGYWNTGKVMPSAPAFTVSVSFCQQTSAQKGHSSNSAANSAANLFIRPS